jgi:hypothetical protein
MGDPTAIDILIKPTKRWGPASYWQGSGRTRSGSP